MCIAIAKPIGKVITKEVLKTCFENNSDGAGFACRIDGKLFVYKAMGFDDFYTKFKEMDDAYRAESPFIIHFRIRTSGTTDTFNCHPFIVNDDIAFIHNGIIRCVPDCPDKKKNDTQMYNELILQHLPETWWRNPAIELLLSETINASKLVFLNINDPELWIINENKGEWVDGIWYSNSSYKTRTYYRSTNGYNNYTKKYCKTCNIDVTNNIYAKNVKEDFCTKRCKDIYEENKSKANTKACEYCGKIDVKSFYGYRFCSYLCETNFIKDNGHIARPEDKKKASKSKENDNNVIQNYYISNEETFTKDEIYYELQYIDSDNFAIDPTTTDILIKCCWCNEFVHYKNIVKIYFHNKTSDKADYDYIDSTCLAELKEYIKEISIKKK